MSHPLPYAGKEFTIKFCPRSAAQYGGGSGKDGGAGSETGSVYSDSGDSKVTTLMADDAEVISFSAPSN
jgi:hypothetical protein